MGPFRLGIACECRLLPNFCYAYMWIDPGRFFGDAQLGLDRAEQTQHREC